MLAFIAIFPILAYLLANQTTNKGIIFGLSLIVISLCLIIFISKFSVIGSFKKQVLNNEILEEIYIDSKISKNAFEGIESLLQADEILVWLISFIGKAKELNKLTLGIECPCPILTGQVNWINGNNTDQCSCCNLNFPSQQEICDKGAKLLVNGLII